MLIVRVHVTQLILITIYQAIFWLGIVSGHIQIQILFIAGYNLIRSISVLLVSDKSEIFTIVLTLAFTNSFKFGGSTKDKGPVPIDP